MAAEMNTHRQHAAVIRAAITGYLEGGFDAQNSALAALDSLLVEIESERVHRQEHQREHAQAEARITDLLLELEEARREYRGAASARASLARILGTLRAAAQHVVDIHNEDNPFMAYPIEALEAALAPTSDDIAKRVEVTQSLKDVGSSRHGHEMGSPVDLKGQPFPESAPGDPVLPEGTNTSGVVPGWVTPGAPGAEVIHRVPLAGEDQFGDVAEQPVTRGGEEGLPSTATGLPTSNTGDRPE